VCLHTKHLVHRRRSSSSSNLSVNDQGKEFLLFAPGKFNDYSTAGPFAFWWPEIENGDYLIAKGSSLSSGQNLFAGVAIY
jgi:hypothetical protein